MLNCCEIYTMDVSLSKIKTHIIMTYPKHSKQVNRQLKNMSKSIILDLKKHTRKQIKNVQKNDKLSYQIKSHLLMSFNLLLEDLKRLKKNNLTNCCHNNIITVSL